MNKKLRRSVAALATAFACLALLSSPAGAVVTDVTATISTGNVRLQNGTSILDIALGGGGGTGCSTNIDAQFDVAATSNGTVKVTDLTSIGRFQAGTTYYVAEMNDVIAGQVTGAINGTTNAISGVGVRITATIFTATNQSATATDCAHGTTVTCRYSNVNLTFSGSYTGNIHSIATTDSAALTSAASTTLVGLPCSPPFSTYTGGTATATSLGMDITSIP